MITVLVVDDQSIVRSGLRTMLDAETDITVIGTSADGLEAVEAATRLRPQVVLMDIRMPQLDGIAATSRILETLECAVVLITTFDDEEYLLAGIAAGASGFLLKDAGADLLAAAVRAARRGDALIDPGMTRALIEQRMSATRAVDAVPTPRSAALDTLSERERDILRALARGQSNAEIAAELYLSTATVKTHISNVLGKTGARTRVQAAVLAYEAGFVQPGQLEGPLA